MKKQTLLIRMLFIFSLLSFGSGCTLSGGYDTERDGGKGYRIVKTARTQIGKPYKWGGSTPQKGFDCSGLVYWAYQQHGIKVPRVTIGQASVGRSVSRRELLPGDIVAFSPKWQRGKHTGIYTGRGKFIHSPKKGARVREESIDVAYWRNCFNNGRRVR